MYIEYNQVENTQRQSVFFHNMEQLKFLARRDKGSNRL